MRGRLGLLFAPKLFAGPGKYVVYALNRIIFSKYWNRTLQDILDRYFVDTRLKDLLAVHCDKTLMRPNEASFLSWAVIQNSYQNGACYPSGSGETISRGLRDKIIANGGAVRTNAGVRQILLHGNRVKGVLLDSGETLVCKKVISDIGIIETAERLMPEGRISPKQRLVVARYKPSGAYMTLHIGFEGDLSSFGIQNANYRVLGEDPYDFEGNPLTDAWRPTNVLISFPSIRDQAHTDTLHHTAEMIVPVAFRHFESWVGTGVNKRGDDYLNHKKRITERLVAVLDTTFPGIRSCVAYTNLSTPMSYRDYTGHKHGAAYGLSSGIGRLTDLSLSPVSDVKGLYYTGADTLSQGITGTFISGVFTAIAASGKFRIFNLKPNSSA
jgi:all-trans-retinol 13,14-reductase